MSMLADLLSDTAQDIKGLPFEFVNTFRPSNMRAKGYAWWIGKGDTNAFLAILLDNIATILTLAGMAIGLGFEPQFVYSHFMGGVGLSILVGNVYYALQASKVAMQTGNMDTCAQPYGINTPGAIAKTFGILGVVLQKELDAGANKNDAMETAWSTACAANFIGALLEAAGAFIAPLLTTTVPQGAFLTPIGGISLAYLGLGPLFQILNSGKAHNPIVSFVPFIIILIDNYGASGLFGSRVPSLAVAAVVGIVLNLLVRSSDFDEYEDTVRAAWDIVDAHGLKVPKLSLISDAVSEYGSLVIGLACTNFIGTFACNIAARRVGDAYSPMESMLVDGLGSMLGALFGSPYGTTVYIGHITYKKMGAKRGYSLACGAVNFLLGMFGLHSIVDAILPHEIVSGVLICIGIGMASECFYAVPKRWYPAVALGLTICFADFIVSNGVVAAVVQVVQNGYVFSSFLYCFLVMMVIDRWFLGAAAVSLILALTALVGLIHAEKLSFEYHEDGTIKGSEALAEELSSGQPGWKYITMYSVVMVLFTGLHFAQKKGLVEAPEKEDYRAIQKESYSPRTETRTVAVDENKVDLSTA